MKFIPTALHAVIDYIYGITLIAISWIPAAHFTPAGIVLLNVAGIGVLLYSMLTKYELGFLQVIPMRVHLLLDVVFGALFALSPWIFNLDSDNTAFFVVPGVFSVIAGLLTKTSPADNYMR